VCRDFLEPATANVVHEALGLAPEAMVFDLSNACLGALNAILMIANMIELGQIDAGLVVAGENGKPLVDSTIEALLSDPSVTRKTLKRAFPSLTIGSGAAAVLVAKKDLVRSGHPLLGATVRSATEYHPLCRGGDGGVSADTGVRAESELEMQTDAEALLLAGVQLARRNWQQFAQAFGYEHQAPDRVITHQVGKTHHRALLESLGLEADTAYVSFDRLGNVGSVSLPMSLAWAEDEGFVRRGDEVALLGIGSGLSSLMLRVDW
jgi:3-oxoacyl-[acyl-carrier-protein] synthase-3